MTPDWENLAFEFRERAMELILALEDISGEARLDFEPSLNALQETCDEYDELYKESL